jgi:CRP-like cAMP-binding protein
VFIGIHATRSWGIVRERQPVEFTGDEQLLYEKTFSSLSPQQPQQFEHLAAIGEWRELDAGHVVHSAGDPPESLEAIVRGEVEARRGSPKGIDIAPLIGRRAKNAA